ncbi:LUD domain-containing protein [Rhodococcus sp. NPDC057014]|uniref:LUD domain-containing protein n=1 Tax=Rhodococcus sp. NPDC057014 TaxID=3346000 RepID=UPI003629D297
MTENPIVELAVDESFAVPADPDRVERAAESLRRNGFTAHIADTIDAAHTLVTDLLPTDKTIFTTTSETLRHSGLDDTINSSGRFRSLRAEQSDWDMSARHDDVRVTRSAPDVVIGSVHAVTEDGRLVTASASGSQLAPYASGADLAVWVVGAQKVVPDLATALRRIETYSYPREDVRAQHVYGVRSTISKILINGRELVPGRGTVVLVREAIGY